ncbi:MAG: hypothetical protein A2750_02230 [Candidatus Yanofskybacteria bacterium RIFCSPHIGHO2_01_FULL_45_42]|uniref:UVR domain-containing protein n=2 Tax=Candidatus Yanofskyibacteriota TaxID=1752733 RepID=A0A1F8FIF1_9BACT|nr:MAG: hypothetical protein A2750_02230 [Candidatus Yanofskybacteria bacterium RIFCSPHIGHO2_01_FULL_45_42]OGN12882.1 MAG: hypothetical protein A3J47_00020 [Candidatus Yanofskybacteria bacterium RIFCSPHIGHO2_02_FULL_43_22]
MYWANFLHIYQPPTQKEIWVRRITQESYRKIFDGLSQIKRARLTLNINGILCELLDKWGGQDVLQNIRRLVESGNLELTGSAKFHAFLPLLPEKEIERQILLNEETLNKYFGIDWKKGGFFSPEMAYSFKVAKVAARLGYKWIILDELGFPADSELSPNVVYQIDGLKDFGVFFRERTLSFTILSAQIGTVPTVLRHLGDRIGRREYIITAMDGETFGHHRPGMETFLFDLLNEPIIEPVMLSDLAQHFHNTKTIAPQNSTWAATKDDIQDGKPFARWKSDDNSIQQAQWQLTDLAIEIANRKPIELKIRRMLDEAVHSDQYWWASAKPWWSLEMMERGAYELKTLIQMADKAKPEEKKTAEELYQKIILTAFDWQRSGYVDEISRNEDEEILERLEEKEKPFITKNEFQQMIDTMNEQMRLAAKAEEYHRAAMIKDRIRELKEEMEKVRTTSNPTPARKP